MPYGGSFLSLRGARCRMHRAFWIRGRFTATTDPSSGGRVAGAPAERRGVVQRSCRRANTLSASIPSGVEPVSAVLDIVLVLLLLGYLVHGYRLGLIRSVGALAGIAAGAVAATLVAPL